ncbi:MAG: glycosyltransferase family 4 protein [Planctomycetota bacterium]
MALKVLLISHTCVSPTAGQPKAWRIAQDPRIDLSLVVPHRWRDYGRWTDAQLIEEAPASWQVHRVRWPWSGSGQWYLHHYPDLADTLRRVKPDVIDVWEEPWGLVSAQAAFLRNRLLPDAKLISETEQNIDKRLPPPFRWFRSYTLKNADFVIGRSEEAVEVLRNHGYRGEAASVPNAVDAELFKPMDRQRCRSAFGFSDQQFVVGYAGRLVEEKGLLNLLEAIKQSPAHTRLVLAGSGPLEPQLRQRVDDLGLDSRVEFLGAMPFDRLPELFNAIDVLALPSLTTARWKEQFGRVLIEAHACGTPVIGSDSGAIPEVVGKGGLVVPEANSDALANAVSCLASDPEAARQMGHVGRQCVDQNYSWERVAQRMVDIYHQVAALPNPSAKQDNFLKSSPPIGVER